MRMHLYFCNTRRQNRRLLLPFRRNMAGLSSRRGLRFDRGVQRRRARYRNVASVCWNQSAILATGERRSEGHRGVPRGGANDCRRLRHVAMPWRECLLSSRGMAQETCRGARALRPRFVWAAGHACHPSALANYGVLLPAAISAGISAESDGQEIQIRIRARGTRTLAPPPQTGYPGQARDLGWRVESGPVAVAEKRTVARGPIRFIDALQSFRCVPGCRRSAQTQLGNVSQPTL